MRHAGNFSAQENIVYTYWIVVLQLLQIGIAWEAIMQFTENEIMLVMGVNGAFEELKAEAQAQASARNRMI